MDQPTLKVKRLHPDAVMPRYALPGDAGFDLAAVERVYLLAGESRAFRTGLAFEVPDGWEMQIRPRSGLALKHGLTVLNAPGTVDSGFRGEVLVILHNTRRVHSFEAPPGTRIAQAVLSRAPQALIVPSAELPDAERGDRGFGSTG